jgi:hypothetical protein
VRSAASSGPVEQEVPLDGEVVDDLEEFQEVVADAGDLFADLVEDAAVQLAGSATPIADDDVKPEAAIDCDGAVQTLKEMSNELALDPAVAEAEFGPAECPLEAPPFDEEAVPDPSESSSSAGEPGGNVGSSSSSTVAPPPEPFNMSGMGYVTGTQPPHDPARSIGRVTNWGSNLSANCYMHTKCRCIGTTKWLTKEALAHWLSLGRPVLASATAEEKQKAFADHFAVRPKKP